MEPEAVLLTRAGERQKVMTAEQDQISRHRRLFSSGWRRVAHSEAPGARRPAGAGAPERVAAAAVHVVVPSAAALAAVAARFAELACRAAAPAHAAPSKARYLAAWLEHCVARAANSSAACSPVPIAGQAILSRPVVRRGFSGRFHGRKPLPQSSGCSAARSCCRANATPTRIAASSTDRFRACRDSCRGQQRCRELSPCCSAPQCSARPDGRNRPSVRALRCRCR